MLNRLSNAFADSDRASRTGARPWRVDGSPNGRLAWLGVLFVLPLLAVVLRLAHVQQTLQASIVETYQQTTETIEPIASRDGRILSSDGRVLAYDVERYDIHAHYRWLEQPADADWLRQSALSHLSRTDRNDRRLVRRAEREVLAARREMWQRLSAATGVTTAELIELRQQIQERVERIVHLVERHRRERTDAAETAGDEPSETAGDLPPDAAPTDVGWWTRAIDTLVTTLTTPPRRRRSEPVVVREEIEHHLLLEDVPRDVAAAIAAHPELYPGLRIKTSTERVYPAHEVAAHVIGNRLEIRPRELKRRAAEHPAGDPLDYRAGDRIGRNGVERNYDRYLHGLRGARRITANRRGEIIAREVIRPPQVGRDVVLTLHMPLQERAEYLLDRAIEPNAKEGGTAAARSAHGGGAIVALDVHTGEVLAAASAPRFDLNLLISPDPQLWRAVNSDPRRPFFPRVRKMAIAPGSVFKTMTAISLMESGRFDPDAKIFCQGYLDNPNRYRCYIFRHYGVGHGEMDLTDALARSCNVYFFSAARTVGPEPIVDWASRFGFGRPTGIDLPGELGGNLPRPPDLVVLAAGREDAGATKDEPQHPWYPGDTLGLAIGQSRLTVTPLQIARMMAVVANGGYLVTPHVVRGFGPSLDGGEQPEISGFRQPRRLTGLGQATLARVREGLKKVVSHPRGTGYKNVRLEQIAIAGKTGTAETGGNQGDHAWFAGYAPADNPRVAFVVVLEHAGSGGSVAGPVARQLVEAMLELRVLEPTRTEGTNPEQRAGDRQAGPRFVD